MKCLESISHSSTKNNITNNIKWWIEIVEVLIGVFGDELGAIRALALSILSDLSQSVLLEIKHEHLLLILMYIETSLSDPNDNVRTNSCGTLATLVELQIVRDNILFLLNCSAKIGAVCGDSKLSVRVRAFCALGNLAIGLQSHPEHVDRNLILSLIQVAIHGVQDNEKVTCV
jgi:hypothetical protein